MENITPSGYQTKFSKSTFNDAKFNFNYGSDAGDGNLNGTFNIDSNSGTVNLKIKGNAARTSKSRTKPRSRPYAEAPDYERKRRRYSMDSVEEDFEEQHRFDEAAYDRNQSLSGVEQSIEPKSEDVEEGEIPQDTTNDSDRLTTPAIPGLKHGLCDRYPDNHSRYRQFTSAGRAPRTPVNSMSGLHVRPSPSYSWFGDFDKPTEFKAGGTGRPRHSPEDGWIRNDRLAKRSLRVGDIIIAPTWKHISEDFICRPGHPSRVDTNLGSAVVKDRPFIVTALNSRHINVVPILSHGGTGIDRMDHELREEYRTILNRRGHEWSLDSDDVPEHHHALVTDGIFHFKRNSFINFVQPDTVKYHDPIKQVGHVDVKDVTYLMSLMRCDADEGFQRARKEEYRMPQRY
ncbi:MAG: hypothetical protein M1820_008137 [Bogoriella megaspora]|nr:MAG: hypothetical protein M1820_008137 [Bogoriella megaspora]